MHLRAAHLPSSPLSLRFGRVVQARSLRESVSTRSGGSFAQGRGQAKEPVSKNVKLLHEVGFLNVRVARLPDSPLSLRFGRVVRAGHLRAFASTLSVESFRRGCTWAKEAVSKNAKL